MGKLMLFICVALLVGGVLSATTGRRWTPVPRQPGCGNHGDSCGPRATTSCCPGMRCQSYVQKCQVIITADDLNAQRMKILGRRGPDQ